MSRGWVCLQGGGEFSPACREMDALLLEGLSGPVVVSALAGSIGRDYATATANGVRHFAGLGARDVVAAPDAREDREGALAALRAAELVVLPGGSPRRLLEALTTTGAAEVVADVLARGGRVMGASAGAMVLGPRTVLPERGATAAPGLGLSPVAVIPHWSGARPDWERALGDGVPLVGLPEESGVLVRDGALTAVGVSATRLVDLGRDLAVGERWEVP